MITVRELEQADLDAWNDLVAQSPHGNVFLRAEWLQMLSDTDSSLQILKLGCFDEKDRLVGGQAICWRKRWGMPVSTEFEFFYSGPVLASPTRKNPAHRASNHARILTALAQELAARLDYVRVDTHPSLRDVRALLYAGWQVEPTYTHIWEMQDVDLTWQAMHREKRREIRRAREQYSFGEEGEEALDAFLPLYHQTMLKFSWRPSVRWEEMFRQRFRWMHERDGCRLYVARTKDGEMAGGVVVLPSREDQTAYLWRQGSGGDHVEAGVVPALYWHAACDLAGELPTINFGGSPQPSLSCFKDYLGAKAVLHFSLAKCDRRFRLSFLERAVKLKDTVYNMVAPVIYRPWQRMRYG